MSLKCCFQYDDGTFCKKWAKTGSRFCHNHQPQGASGPRPDGHSLEGWPALHPFARLAMPADLFELVRETLNATRMGKVAPAQAHAIVALANVWLRIHEKLEHADRLYALDKQILPSLVDAESAAHAERVAAQTAEGEHDQETAGRAEPAVSVPLAAGRAAEPALGPEAVSLAEAQARLEEFLAACAAG
jgi:hypothetical protein